MMLLAHTDIGVSGATRPDFEVLNLVPMGVMVVSHELRILFWNTCLEDWTGVHRDQVLDCDLLSQFPHLRKGAYVSRLQTIFDGGPPTIFSAQLHGSLIPSLLPNGQKRVQHTTVTAVSSQSGAKFDALLAIQDVTDLTQRNSNYRAMRDQALEEVRVRQAAELTIKDLNENLQRRATELERSNAEMEAFSYTVSHDLRAPLRATKGFASFLLEDYTDVLDDVGTDYAQRIVSASERMDDLITDLLEYSQLSRSLPMLKAVSLQAVISSVLADHDEEIATRGAQIVIGESLPTVQGHATTLRQVFDNLISNALKFSSPEREPQIHISGATKGARAIILVRDNGLGIETTYHEKVFEVFERLHPSDDKYPGTGIGLAIVRKGLERLGGSIQLLPDAAQGCCFELDLTLART